METAKRVASYLESLGNVRNVKPVRVTIGKAVYEGADYEQVGHYESVMDGVRSGKFKAGQEYTNRRLYLVGALPASYVRSRRTAYRFEGDSRDWYVGAYMPKENLKPENAQFHPFGINFLLCVWESGPDGSTIDSFEDRPYARVAAKLETE